GRHGRGPGREARAARAGGDGVGRGDLDPAQRTLLLPRPAAPLHVAMARREARARRRRRMTYEAYLAGMTELLQRYGVTDFSAAELATPEGGVPPRELWPNAIPTIVRIQRLRTRLGRAIYICTPAHPRRGYRTAEVNQALGG